MGFPGVWPKNRHELTDLQRLEGVRSGVPGCRHQPLVPPGHELAEQQPISPHDGQGQRSPERVWRLLVGAGL